MQNVQTEPKGTRSCTVVQREAKFAHSAKHIKKASAMADAFIFTYNLMVWVFFVRSFFVLRVRR